MTTLQLTQSPTSITIGILIVIVILIIVATIIVIICLIVRHIKIKNEVIKNSNRLRELQTVNLRYSPSFTHIEPLQRHEISLDSKGKFDRFRPENYLMLLVANDLDRYSNMLHAARENGVLWQNYNAEISALSATQYEKKSHIKTEKRLFKRHKIKEPVTNPRIMIQWQYTSPQGRNHYDALQEFYIPDVENAILEAQKKTTRQAQISKERALMTDKLRYKVMERDGFKCTICGSSANDGVKLHVDHIYPVSKGGKTELSNLRTLCDRCNLGKGAHVETQS